LRRLIQCFPELRRRAKEQGILIKPQSLQLAPIGEGCSLQVSLPGKVCSAFKNFFDRHSAMTNDTWSADAITDKIREIAKATFGMDLVNGATPIKQSGLDSMALIDIVMGLEESFGCQLPLERLPADPTMDDFVILVQAALAKQ
jgi:acyl carrier protein